VQQWSLYAEQAKDLLQWKQWSVRYSVLHLFSISACFLRIKILAVAVAIVVRFRSRLLLWFRFATVATGCILHKRQQSSTLQSHRAEVQIHCQTVARAQQALAVDLIVSLAMRADLEREARAATFK
jgi:hypothetical protein